MAGKPIEGKGSNLAKSGLLRYLSGETYITIFGFTNFSLAITPNTKATFHPGLSEMICPEQSESTSRHSTTLPAVPFRAVYRTAGLLFAAVLLIDVIGCCGGGGGVGVVVEEVEVEGTNIFCPTDRLFPVILLSDLIISTVVLYWFAILYKVSPACTV